MFKNLVIMIAAALVSNTAFADHHEGHKVAGDFTVGGDLAVKYTMQGSKNDGLGAGGATNPQGHDVIAVDLAELNVKKAVGNSGFHLGIGYGSVPAGFNNVTLGLSTLNLLNANYTYKHDSGVGVIVGKFGSVYGFENYNPRKNMNYTRTYGFTLKNPVDTGAGLTYNHEMFDAGFYVLNSLNNISTAATGLPENNNNKSFLVDVVLKLVEGLKLKVDFGTGGEGAAAAYSTQTMYNVLAMYNWDNMLDLGVNYAARTNDVSGTKAEASSIAAYVGYNMDDFGAALRYEMADDKGGVFRGTAANKINSLTLTGKYMFDTGAHVFAEYRMDSDDKNTFKDDKGAAKDSDSWLNLGVMYNF